MTDYALLNNVEHKDLRVRTGYSAELGDAVMYAPTYPAEFRSVQSCYPILFASGEKGHHTPVALFGFQTGENLFLDEDGWNAHYVPAMVRRQPFLIGYQDQSVPGGPDRIRVLSIDMAHPRVNRDEGEALFQPLGGRTPYLENVANLLEDIYQGLDHSSAFVAALNRHELLESVSFDIALDDDSRNKLVGFHAIDEEKVQALGADVLGELASRGFLLPLFMVLASTANIRRLVELKNKTLSAAA